MGKRLNYGTEFPVRNESDGYRFSTLAFTNTITAFMVGSLALAVLIAGITTKQVEIHPKRPAFNFSQLSDADRIDLAKCLTMRGEACQ